MACPNTPAEQPHANERYWRNGWGITCAYLRNDGPQCEGFRVWFEGPRAGWVFFHLDLIGMGEFICRASQFENDFLGDLVAAIRGILTTEEATVAASHGEPISFEFRFSRQPGSKEIRFDLVGFPNFERDPAQADPVLGIAPNGDGVCRGFCFGLRRLQTEIGAEAYQAAMGHAFPTAGLAEICELLGGEFASDASGTAS